MPAEQRIVCRWCASQNLPGATVCQNCGAPLDVRNIVSYPDPDAPPMFSPAPIAIGYRSPHIEGDADWVTVATFPYCGALHAAKALLARVDIVSRIGPAMDHSPDFNLQTLATHADWAREVLAREAPQAVVTLPASGFPVVMAKAGFDGVAPQRALPVPVIPLPLEEARRAG
jgi:hypothetical protein